MRCRDRHDTSQFRRFVSELWNAVQGVAIPMSRWIDNRDDFSSQAENLEDKSRENSTKECPYCDATVKDLPYHLRNKCSET